jgi:carboxymethylenebutenolidase
MAELQIDIPTADGTAQAFLFHPDSGGPFPAVIYETDIRGIRPVFMDMARKVAAAGYAVLMPNLFYRLSPPPVIDPAIVWGSDAAMTRFGELFGAVTPEGLARDHEAFFKFLESQPSVAKGKVATAGYCMGGTAAFRVAGDFPDKVAAAASFHGGRLAADDASMTDAMIAQLNQALDAAGVDYVTDQYAARHGYAVKDNPAHDDAAEALHWTRLFEMLEKTFAR